MANNQSAQNQLANRGKQQAAKQQNNPGNTIEAYLKKMGPKLQEALPKHMDQERLTRITMTTIRQNPKLLEASVPSLLGAIMQAAQLGLEPGLTGHCYLVPFYNGKQKQTDVQFIIGYRGMIDLARRSGHIQSIYAHTVHANDEFEYELGLQPKLVHKPSTGDRGDMQFVYAVAHFKDGGYQFEVFSKNDVDKVKERSKAGGGGPWKTDYEEMAKKTVIRRMFKYLPISIEVQNQASQDETMRQDVTKEPQQVDDSIIDVPYNEPQDEPEPEPEAPAEEPQEEKKTDADEELPFN